jgi:hypothetical protein
MLRHDIIVYAQLVIRTAITKTKYAHIDIYSSCLSTPSEISAIPPAVDLEGNICGGKVSTPQALIYEHCEAANNPFAAMEAKKTAG